MKRLLPILLLAVAMMLSSCAWVERHTPWHHNTAPQAAPNAPGSQPQARAKAKATAPTIVTPDDSLSAKVLTINTVGRFVVLNFPEGRLPKLDQHMFLYRQGLKTAEVKIVGPQQDTSIVADIISGDAQPGDTVRDQ
jgi:hypothetical protein